MAEYEDQLRRRIAKLIASGKKDFRQVLKGSEGADPWEVKNIFDELTGGVAQHTTTENYINQGVVGKSYLPAPDPSYNQWWFEEETIKDIAEKVRDKIQAEDSCKVLCIGTPTLAIKTSENYETTLLDIDQDIVDLFNRLERDKSKGITFDIKDPLNEELKDSFSLALVDPPWYEPAIRIAINRAIEAVGIGGDIFLSFPGRLTRPGIEELRSNLIKEVVDKGHTIDSIEHNSLSYIVPFFEKNALKELDGFKAISWRKGDLIVIKKGSETLLDHDVPEFEESPKTFSRKPKEFRVFLKGSSLSGNLAPRKVEDYSRNISSRAISTKPDVWTTSKVGLQISDHILMAQVLDLWQKDKNREEVMNELLSSGKYEEDTLSETLNKLEEYFELWGVFSSPMVLRDPQEIIEHNEDGLSPFAVTSKNKKTSTKSDGFRAPFSRDRDRLIWSGALKRLADKTQLFPSTIGDTVRRRLTHTLEVQQLALTIGASLGLNLELIEACALAHDIGHTPFGHAGEYAIDKIFKEISPDLNGFNHYEHGLDVMAFIESPYSTDPYQPFLGLNISNEVLEAVLKHTYYHSGNELGSEELVQNSKHKKKLVPGYCHLEGQAVRIADKISYLISDVEDGLRLGAIDIFDLVSCELFHVSPLFFNTSTTEDAIAQFLRQRKSIIKILMEDVITSSTLRISQKNIVTAQDARDADAYIIDHSPEAALAVGEVWYELQEKRLFSDSKVQSANMLAAKIVSELVILFAVIPDLIEKEFSEPYKIHENSEYLERYRENGASANVPINSSLLSFMPFHLMIGGDNRRRPPIEVSLFHLIQAKDYVASLSDYKARKLHNLLLTNEIR